MPSTVADFRRFALALPNAIESSHMGHPDFRITEARGNARIFATLSAQDRGLGVLKLTLDQQQAFIAELPKVFSPVQGGWGRMGMTFIHLAAADHAMLEGALATAHRNVELKQQLKKGTKAVTGGPKIARTAAKRATVRSKKT
jgi:hypothetical protein